MGICVSAEMRCEYAHILRFYIIDIVAHYFRFYICHSKFIPPSSDIYIKDYVVTLCCCADFFPSSCSPYRIERSGRYPETIQNKYTISHGGIPAPLGYEGYPKSVCVSIDEVVCHGIPDKNRILKQGEIVNVDVTTILNGYFADASRMFCIGDVGQEKQKLVEFTKECLELGVQAAKPWGYLGDIGYVISQHAYENGYSVVREIGGHGVGLEFHEEPWVSHIGEPNTDMILVPGMIFTIEPMINIGAEDVYEDEKDGWTIRTKDGKPSAQWEYTLLITETGNEILTW